VQLGTKCLTTIAGFALSIALPGLYPGAQATQNEPIFVRSTAVDFDASSLFFVVASILMRPMAQLAGRFDSL
jgi:hypothetical protein